ncbi:hypothetical protein CHS0354_026111 [Potamilus streckersoni]|uniref:Uncharacterized protein n=1 Tax=Potamilus streckersoni TaxID=2493646 RepID=A0AAE0VMB9_9BIVA|nr:hypothetical protein CHS0354_026111 [Potamilus streckersoni]
MSSIKTTFIFSTLTAGPTETGVCNNSVRLENFLRNRLHGDPSHYNVLEKTYLSLKKMNMQSSNMGVKFQSNLVGKFENYISNTFNIDTVVLRSGAKSLDRLAYEGQTLAIAFLLCITRITEQTMATGEFHLIFAVTLLVFIPYGASQNICNFRLEVPNVEVCNLSGGLAEDFQENFFKLEGNLQGLVAFQDTSHDFLQTYLHGLNSQDRQTEEQLYKLMKNLQALQSLVAVHESVEEIEVAIPVTNLNVIDTVRKDFAKAVADLENKLTNLSIALKDNEKMRVQLNIDFERQLQINHKNINQAVQNVQTLESAITRALATASVAAVNANAPNASILSNLSDEIFKLSVRVETVRILTDSNLKDLERRAHVSENDVSNIGSDLQNVKSTLQTVDSVTPLVTANASIIRDAATVFGDRVGAFLQNNTMDVFMLKTNLSQIQQDVTGIGNDLLKFTIGQASFRSALSNLTHQVHSLDSLIVFSSGIEKNETGQVLSLQLVLESDKAALAYAFAVSDKIPRNFPINGDGSVANTEGLEVPIVHETEPTKGSGDEQHRLTGLEGWLGLKSGQGK